MARQSRHRDRVFTAGIVWDPREPLPGELQPGYGVGPSGWQVPKAPPGAAAAYFAQGPRFDRFDGHVELSANYLHMPAGNVGQPIGMGGTQHIQAATTWPNLPSSTVQEQDRNILPPLSVEVDASVLQDTAQVAVTQRFWNDSTVAIKQAAFTFPLPAGCTVTDFTCQFGTRKIIRGSVKPREEAREEFQRHIRRHDTGTGLLEQDTPEIFTTTLGNIPAKTKVKVNLTYITILKHRFADSRNVTTLTIPTYIARRYGNAPEDYNGAESSSVPQGLTLEVEIVEFDRITSITSPSHVIEVKRRHGARNAESFADLAGEGGRSSIETAAVALPSNSMLLDRDFVLDIETKPHGNSESPQAWLEEHLTLPNHRALMLTLPPQCLTHAAPPMQHSEILFLADRSGSMSDKMASLKSAMRFFLKGIPEGRKFNIWCFGTHYNSFRPLSVDYGESTLTSALAWVERTFAADMGGTELLPAIQAIVQARDKSLMTDVIVLTDGETWRLDQTLEYIEKTRGLTDGRVRFFALGIGNAVSHALVDGIAKAGGGYAEVVQESSRGGWEDRVVSMAKAALLSAHLGPLHLSFQIQDQNGRTRSSTFADGRRSPADTSDLSPFNQNRIYFLFSDAIAESESITSVTVEMAANQQTKAVVIPVTALDKRDTMLHKLAARSMLDDLERGRSHIHLGPNRPYQGSWEERSLVREEAEEIACKWALVSKWTSLFLTEELLTFTEKDPFMEGVVEVTEAPGDDLLEPRQDSLMIGSLESWQDSLMLGTSPSFLQSVGTVGFETGALSGGSLELGFAAPGEDTGSTTRRNHASTPQWKVVPQGSCTGPFAPPSPELMPSPDSPIFSCVRGSPASRPLPIHGPDYSFECPEEYDWDLCEHAEVEMGYSTETGVLPGQMYGGATVLEAEDEFYDPQAQSETDFISSLLIYLQFDGSIVFGGIHKATKHLGRETVDALRELWVASTLDFSWTMLCTAAVLVLLERDMQSSKSLWELMAMKMAGYCEKHSPADSAGLHGPGKTPGWLDEVKKQLEGLRLPIHQRKGVEQIGVGEAPAPGTPPNEGDNTRDNTLPQPQPEVGSFSDTQDSTGGSGQVAVPL
ncbi:hypothetical protein N658DRAFT_498274 [Parathielavia hyrcaniae]|uniref:Uncharacterized protein n=1 Tax=Parathielavia hyrcaniae TaxID=113614 RepID=A0AAN6SZV3_9PEZI|nr:hypothetical protein N658DRAFT_498274 [Parathielavia hyrcaniae]